MKMKYFLGLTVIALIMGITASCGEGGGGSNVDTAAIWKTHCQLCHGADGKLGLNGAKDLTASPLSLDERIQVITKGRNTMASYEATLTAEEIAAIAKYTTKLK